MFIHKFFIYREFETARKGVDKFIYDIIESRKHEPADELAKKRDLLSSYLRMTDDNTGLPYSDTFIRYLISCFVCFHAAVLTCS